MMPILARRPTRREFAALILAAAMAPLGAALAQGADGAALRALVDGGQRSAANRARDVYRHPFEVLTFFGVADNSSVVEILPGASGYWTEILAPYLKARGRYIAANGDRDSPSAEVQKDNAGFAAKTAADPADYGKVETAEFHPGVKELAPPGSVDFVLTFRNIHNWMAAGTADQAFATFFKALKPAASSASRSIAAGPTSRRIRSPRAVTSARTTLLGSPRRRGSNSPARPR